MTAANDVTVKHPRKDIYTSIEYAAHFICRLRNGKIEKQQYQKEKDSCSWYRRTEKA